MALGYCAVTLVIETSCTLVAFRSGQARPGQEAAVLSLLETTEALLQAFWTSPVHTTTL